MFAHEDDSDRARPVTGTTRFAARLCWYVRALGFHPLIRTVDRLESFAVLGVLVIALVAVPAASSAAGLVHDSGLQTAQEQTRTRHSVQATVVAGVGLPTDMNTPAYVRAQWREGTHLRTESVVSHAATKPGDPMTVWLDTDGKVVTAPMQPADAELQALVAGLAVWTFISMGGALLAWLVRLFADRARYRAWDRELRLLVYNDDGWADRHS
ncbi:Rv1733c family protein [Mycobacterium sp. NPDC003323]